ncbi:hypothetical protein K2173_012661 [Erythroxylum novogranatense]|uniref:Chaperonin 10 n=1 Tax=Erythroxylum novogranatense TaxID=1862640 RepID=A0AAV8S6P8_9ROSI|nr:hypothetical protein K2173_012661 [Erythroxylum novogranatense]
MAKRLIPTLNRVLVEKILNSGKVISVGPGLRSNEGKTIPTSVKEGDTVLLPEYGGTQVKLDDKDYYLYRDEDILGTLHE